MKDKIVELETSAMKDIADANDLKGIEDIRVKYLGKKGLLTSILRGMKDVPEVERPVIGKIINEVKERVTSAIDTKAKELEKIAKEEELKKEIFDITLPGRRTLIGKLHPLTTALEAIKECFYSMGFSIAEGPDVELDYYNFEALNIPKNHPARDMHDTFYIDDNVLLRTHTSPVQVRTMEKQKPPVRIIVPGRVYRYENPDASHSHVFHQVEGLYVDENVHFSNLKGDLEVFAKLLFGKDYEVRFRPSFFPFTEPSAEVDVQCINCKGKGCRVCKNSGWLEIMGCGMVDPAVFGFVNYDPEIYSGYAFGMGLERITMLKYGIDNMKLLYENDIKFLEQF